MRKNIQLILLSLILILNMFGCFSPNIPDNNHKNNIKLKTNNFTIKSSLPVNLPIVVENSHMELGSTSYFYSKNDGVISGTPSFTLSPSVDNSIYGDFELDENGNFSLGKIGAAGQNYFYFKINGNFPTQLLEGIEYEGTIDFLTSKVRFRLEEFKISTAKIFIIVYGNFADLIIRELNTGDLLNNEEGYEIFNEWYTPSFTFRLPYSRPDCGIGKIYSINGCQKCPSNQIKTSNLTCESCPLEGDDASFTQPFTESNGISYCRSPLCPGGGVPNENGQCVIPDKPDEKEKDPCESIFDPDQVKGFTNTVSGNSNMPFGGQSFSTKSFKTSNNQLSNLIYYINELEIVTDKIDLLESKIYSLDERGLSSKSGQLQSEKSLLESKKQSIESIIYTNASYLNGLVNNIRSQINTLTQDPEFSTGYTTKPLDIDEYESNIILDYLLFENATEGVLGKDTYQLFDSSDILSEELQLLSDLISDYTNGVIPQEDKFYAVKVLNVLAKQINEHTGTVEYIGNKLSNELERLKSELVKNGIETQRALREIILEYLVNENIVDPETFEVFDGFATKSNSFSIKCAGSGHCTYNFNKRSYDKTGLDLFDRPLAPEQQQKLFDKITTLTTNVTQAELDSLRANGDYATIEKLHLPAKIVVGAFAPLTIGDAVMDGGILAISVFGGPIGIGLGISAEGLRSYQRTVGQVDNAVNSATIGAKNINSSTKSTKTIGKSAQCTDGQKINRLEKPINFNKAFRVTITKAKEAIDRIEKSLIDLKSNGLENVKGADLLKKDLENTKKSLQDGINKADSGLIPKNEVEDLYKSFDGTIKNANRAEEVTTAVKIKANGKTVEEFGREIKDPVTGKTRTEVDVVSSEMINGQKVETFHQVKWGKNIKADDVKFSGGTQKQIDTTAKIASEKTPKAKVELVTNIKVPVNIDRVRKYSKNNPYGVEVSYSWNQN